jgi:hypothetical protein
VGTTRYLGGGTSGIGSLRLGDATEAERQAAVDLQVGDTFESHGVTYQLVGACEDRDGVWLNQVE